MTEPTGYEADMDLDYLEQWTRNKPVIQTETLCRRPALGLAALLDQSRSLETGEVLPPLWQWVYFTPTPLASELGLDGHPKRGGLLPPVPLPRRMWAASRIQFNAPLYLGETVQKQSGVTAVKFKQGASGPLLFVNVDHQYSVGAELRISEQQTLVYVGTEPELNVESKTESNAETENHAHIEPGEWSRRIQPDPVLLFRYSALTSNTHRIHYDREYAMNVEGQPGLLVHAPLTATLMSGLLHEHIPGLRMSEFSFRALRPLVDSLSFSIHGKRGNDDTVRLWALDAGGRLAVQATARLTDA